MMSEIELIESALNDELIALDCKFESDTKDFDCFKRDFYARERNLKKEKLRSCAEIEKSVALESLLLDVIKKASPKDYSALFVKKALNALSQRFTTSQSSL